MASIPWAQGLKMVCTTGIRSRIALKSSHDLSLYVVKGPNNNGWSTWHRWQTKLGQ